ncbi:MAG TPA: M20 family metallopeptidase [Clostridia bacterium]|nr:M20 family metallopeptidase [Clostridia bacterium]
MNTILEQARALAPEIINWYRTLHQIPETGWVLPQTSAFVAEELEKIGIVYKTYERHSSLIATIKGGVGSPNATTVALRADMDALCVTEETGLPYASKNGNMHACGHDAHTAMLLGAAKLLMLRKEQLKGDVRLIFQAGEEETGVAVDLIKKGALENPSVGAVFGQHVGTLAGALPLGTIAIKPNAAMAAKVGFELVVRGKGCHGAMPTQGIDPIVIASQIVLALQSLVARECDATDSAVISVTSIHGGVNDNIIPDVVTLTGSMRVTDDALCQKLMRRMREVCEGIASSMRGTCDVTAEIINITLVNDPREADFAASVAEKLLGKERVRILDKPCMASEDMADYLNERPGAFWFYSTQGEAVPFGNHSPHFAVEESCLADGAALLAATAEEWLLKNT